MIALVFPGQGSQFVGMGKELKDTFSCARHLFEEVDDALGEKLSPLIFEGPEETLTLTENTQPALMAVSLAVVRILEQESGGNLWERVQVVAGHSLGEYSALAATGALSIADTARLLRLRGRAMACAVPVGAGAMAAILGLPLDAIEGVVQEAAQGEVCEVANDNAVGQVVISGHQEAIIRAMGLAQERGAKRCIPLKVSGPFHCALMEPASRAVAEALKGVSMGVPTIPLIPNVLGQAEKIPHIQENLVSQVTGRVRWRETMEAMAANSVTVCAEVGAGVVLTNLARRALPDAKTFALHKPEDIEIFLNQHLS